MPSCRFFFVIILVIGSALAGAQTPPVANGTPVTIQGTVSGPGGRPLAGARVAIQLPEANEGDDAFADTVTDVDGKFALLAIQLAPGDYVVHASGIGFEALEKPFKVAADPGDLSFELVLKPQGKERGPSAPYTVVRVFYATDRQAVTDKPSVDYIGKRSTQNTLSYGTCDVSIPETHTLAEVERPSIWKLEFHADPEKHLVLQKVSPESKDAFFTNVSAAVSFSPSKDAFVFIHGYNVTFERAAIRTAQLAYDFGFKGVPIFYSWPSKGSLLGYLADEAAVDATTANFKLFLEDVANRTGASVVHVIAHSMGNRAALPALSQLAGDSHFSNFAKFSTIVFAAPDVDPDLFINSVAQIRKPQTKITLYVSEHDQALVISHLLYHKQVRAGEGGPHPIVMPGMDTVDVSPVSADALGHNYYADNSNVVRDVLEFLNGQLAPRPGLSRFELGSLAYWKLTATIHAATGR